MHFPPKNLFIFQSTPPVKAATWALFDYAEVNETFQSTPPVKAATLYRSCRQAYQPISIHAAREGGDRILKVRLVQPLDFNPRRP